jgi:hypothetical protein
MSRGANVEIQDSRWSLMHQEDKCLNSIVVYRELLNWRSRLRNNEIL